MNNNEKNFNPNQLNDYKMTPLELAIQCGEAELVKDIASHPEFDYKQHRPSMFLQILENSSEAYHSPKKVQETKNVLKLIVLQAIEKDPKNFGHYTPTFLRDDREVVLKALEQDLSVLPHASVRLREDLDIANFIRRKVMLTDNKLVHTNEESVEPWYIDKEVLGLSKKHTLDRIKSTREGLQQSNQSNTVSPK